MGKEKLRIYFPEVEAGFGHIMACRAVKEAFEKKYGDMFEIISNDFYKISEDSLVRKYGDKLIKFVEQYTSHPKLGIFAGYMAEMWSLFSTWFTMNFPVPGASKIAIKQMIRIDADVIFSTHWATNYYGIKIKENRPLCVMCCPDIIPNTLFRMKSDMTIYTNETGYEKAKKHIFAKNKNLKLSSFCIRNQFKNFIGKKDELRNKLRIDRNKFLLVIAEGGYGNGKIEKILNLLLEKNLPITIVAIAGKNKAVYSRIKNLKTNSETTLIPLGFAENILEIIACADLFCGKAAGIPAEAAALGVPTLISSVTSKIEIDFKNFYCKKIKTAVYEPNTKKAVELIEGFVKDPTALSFYSDNALKNRHRFNAENVADDLFEFINNNLKIKH